MVVNAASVVSHEDSSRKGAKAQRKESNLRFTFYALHFTPHKTAKNQENLELVPFNYKILMVVIAIICYTYTCIYSGDWHSCEGLPIGKNP
jgi:hypothetical protein